MKKITNLLLTFLVSSMAIGQKTDSRKTDKYMSNMDQAEDPIKKAEREEQSRKTFIETNFFMAVDQIIYIKLKNGEIVKGYNVGYIAESKLKFVAKDYSGLAYSLETQRKNQKTISFKFEEIDEAYIPVVYENGFSPSIKVKNPMINSDDNNREFIYHKNIMTKTKNGDKEVFVMLMNPTFNEKYDVYFSQNTMINNGMPKKLFIKTGEEIIELNGGDYEEFFNKTYSGCPRIFNTKKYLKEWSYFAEHTYRYSKGQCEEQKK